MNRDIQELDGETERGLCHGTHPVPDMSKRSLKRGGDVLWQAELKGELETSTVDGETVTSLAHVCWGGGGGVDIYF